MYVRRTLSGLNSPTKPHTESSCPDTEQGCSLPRHELTACPFVGLPSLSLWAAKHIAAAAACCVLQAGTLCVHDHPSKVIAKVRQAVHRCTVHTLCMCRCVQQQQQQQSFLCVAGCGCMNKPTRVLARARQVDEAPRIKPLPRYLVISLTPAIWLVTWVRALCVPLCRAPEWLSAAEHAVHCRHAVFACMKKPGMVLTMSGQFWLQPDNDLCVCGGRRAEGVRCCHVQGVRSKMSQCMVLRWLL
jgi:hypothetical protein